MMGRTWTLELGEHTPLSLNGQRRNPYVHARMVKGFRRLAWARACEAMIPPLGRIIVELHYAPRDRRRRDPLNLVATLKPVEDGIVNAGVIPDDTPQYSQPTVPVIDEPTGQRGRLYVIVRELEPATGTGDTAMSAPAETHCPTCTCGRRAPVQSSRYSGEKHGITYGPHGAGTISWAEHEEAWAVYGARYSSQSAARIAERGGFGYGELVEFLRREPATWRPYR